MIGYNNGIYNPMTAQAITGAFGNSAISRATTNASGIYDYANNASINSIANNSGLNGGINNYDPYSMNYGLGGLGMGLGCGMGMGMGMYGYGPGMEVMGMTQADYQRYQENLQNQQIDMQTRTRKKLNVADYQATAGEKAVKERIEILQEQIGKNNQDNVMAAYGSLKEAVAAHLKTSGYVNTSGAVDEEFLKSQTNFLYEQVTGMGIPKALQSNSDSYFIHGLKQGLTFDFGHWNGVNRKNGGDNASAITGQAVTESDKGWRLVGQIAGGVVTTAAAILLFRKCPNGVSVIGNVFKGIGKALFGIK